MKRILLSAMLVAAACNTTIIEEIVPASSSTLDGGQSNLGCFFADGAGSYADHGIMWKGPTVLGNQMLWQAWAMGSPWEIDDYIISAGYGGVHPILWSGMTGNIGFNDANGVWQRLPFTSDDPPPAGVFSHVALAIERDYTGNYFINNYVNGILTGKNLIPKGWVRAIPSNTGGWLNAFVGGSNHSNATVTMCQLQAWDDLPVAFNEAPFAPRRQFREDSEVTQTPSDLLVNYVSPVGTTTWADLSGGYNGHAAGYTGTDGLPLPLSPHPGTGFKTNFNSGAIGTISAQPVPHSVAFTAPAPFMADYVEAPVDRGLVPAKPPVGAVLYDSFSRPDQTYAHVTRPDVGCVEYAADGQPHCWQGFMGNTGTVYPSAAQIFNGAMRPGESLPSFEVVHAGKTDLTLSVTRRISGSSEGVIGLAFRMGYDSTGAPNHTGYHVAYVYTANTALSTVMLWRADGPAARVNLKNAVVPHTGWYQLKVKVVGSTYLVYTDNTLVMTFTDSTWLTGDGAGIWFPGVPAVAVSTNQSALDWAVLP